MNPKSSPNKESHLAIVDRLEDIPSFANEDEEHAFWATHELSAALLATAEPFGPDELPAARASARSVVIRLDRNTLERLESLARLKQRDYHALLKEFVTERLYEEEKRAGILPSSSGR